MPQSKSAAHTVDLNDSETLDVMGLLIEFVTRIGTKSSAPCTMRGTIPPGVVIPLHSHADPETYVVVSGSADAIAESDGGLRWVTLNEGAVFHVPGGAKHAFRNQSSAPAVMLVISTSKIARFFRDVGQPVAAGNQPPGSPSAERIRRFLETAERYGYWNATPEENARIGISLPSPNA